MTIFTIIVTWNGMKHNWIAKCLDSLRQSSVPTTPIVIDNCSTDGTRDFVPQNYPEAIWLPQDKNLGFGQANNVGIRYAIEYGADYVLLLNQDATVMPDMIERMVTNSDGKSLLSPIHLNGDGSRLDIGFGKVLRKMNNKLIDDRITPNSTPAPFYDCDQCVPAACWLIPAEIIKNIGGFNPIFFHYGEDNNYHQRVTYHGYKTLIIPTAFMFHDREEHGNMNVFHKGQIKRDLLIYACDINKGFPQFIYFWIKKLYESVIKNFTEKSFATGSMMAATFSLLCRLNSIRKSRNQDKKTEATWLYAKTRDKRESINKIVFA